MKHRFSLVPLAPAAGARHRTLIAAKTAAVAWCALMGWSLAQAQSGTSTPAAGSDYPSRPITLVVGYPPGGSTDLTARVVGAELAKQLGQAVVIENIGGAGGVLGAQKAAKATPDGYTLLMAANNEVAIAPLVQKRLNLQPLKDFTPIGLVASQPMVLVASASNKDAPKSVGAFLQQVQRQPGRFSYGSSGVGTALHLAGEMTKESAKLFMVHIPYRGVAPLTSDLLGGQLEYGIFVLSSALPHIRSGKFVPIGTTQAKRHALTPDVPALSEHPALKSVDISSWFALFAPAGLPPTVHARLQQALQQALAQAEVRRKLEESGATMAAPGVSLAQFHAQEMTKYARIVEFAKIEE